MSYYTPWKDNHEASLRGHLEGGRLSYSGIAAAVNLECGTSYSRNSCIGKAGRLGLTNPYWQKLALLPKRPKKPQPYKPRPKRQPMFVQAGEYVALECKEVKSRGLSLLDLEPTDCRYPTTDDAPYRFCGRSQLEGSSYCRNHFQLTLRRFG